MIAYEVCFKLRDFVYQFDAKKGLLGWRLYDVHRDAGLHPMFFNVKQ